MASEEAIDRFGIALKKQQLASVAAAAEDKQLRLRQQELDAALREKLLPLGAVAIRNADGQYSRIRTGQKRLASLTPHLVAGSIEMLGSFNRQQCTAAIRETKTAAYLQGARKRAKAKAAREARAAAKEAAAMIAEADAKLAEAAAEEEEEETKRAAARQPGADAAGWVPQRRPLSSDDDD